jgi:DNA-binding LacI/PurR family transcriptional regulator
MLRRLRISSGPKHPANLKQLAAHLGLSTTTVSRVMSRTPAAARIPAATQKRVFEAAEQLNYQASAVARSLRQKKSFTVGVIVPEISEGYTASVLSGIEDALLEQDYFYFVVSHRHRPELLKNYISMLQSRGVEGIVAIDTPLDGGLRIPIASVSGHKIRKGIVNIVVDHNVAAHQALNHLASLGHKKIAFIRGQAFSSDTKARWRAIRKVAKELKLEIAPERVVDLRLDAATSEPGQEATERLLGQTRDFSALFAFNDLAAIGAMATLRQHDLRVPRDVSVIGFDDIPSAATNYPGLTTIRQPMQQMGRLAAQALLEAIRGEESHHKNFLSVLPTLVIRKSTAHPRSDKL